MTFLTAVPLQIPGLLKDISGAANSTDNSFRMVSGSGDSHMFTFSGIPFAAFYQEFFLKTFLLCKLYFTSSQSVFLSQLLEEGSIKLLSLAVRILMSVKIHHQ